MPLFFAVVKQKPLKVFFLSFVCGVSYYIATLFWLNHVTVAGMVVLSVYLGLYIALFASGYMLLRPRLGFWHRLCFGSALWVLLEFTRGMLLTGFPWALIAYGQSSNLAVIQAADVVGAYGVSFVVIFVNIFLFEILLLGKNKNADFLLKSTILFVVLLIWFGYGVYRLAQDPKKSVPLKVAMVQGNIAQEIKWVASFGEGIFKKYKLLTEIAGLKKELDLIIWPETAYPDYLELGRNDHLLKQLASEIQTSLLVGSIRLDNLHYYNSALLLTSQGAWDGVYDKIHLVPFGEYIPLRTYLPFLERIVPIEDFTPGKNFKIFSVRNQENQNIKFGVLICFEDILSDIASGFVKRGADFLINMTNDAWFGNTSSPYQHMQASILRAVENRVYVVRAANTGVSCIIDDAGRVKTVIKDVHGRATFVTGSASGLVFRTQRHSLYTKIGDMFAVVCTLYAGLMVFISLVSLRRKKVK